MNNSSRNISITSSNLLKIKTNSKKLHYSFLLSSLSLRALSILSNNRKYQGKVETRWLNLHLQLSKTRAGIKHWTLMGQTKVKIVLRIKLIYLSHIKPSLLILKAYIRNWWDWWKSKLWSEVSSPGKSWSSPRCASSGNPYSLTSKMRMGTSLISSMPLQNLLGLSSSSTVKTWWKA